jgi:hypothetical protein
MVSHNGYDTEVESYQIDGTYSSSPYLEGIEDLEDWNIVEHLPDCTGFDWVPKPVYRPFANRYEFAYHRDKWVRSSDTDNNLLCRAVAYNDTFVFFNEDPITMEEAFKKLLFEDGTPFGVKVS